MKNWTINKYIFLLSILVLSCSKDYIEEEVYLSNSTPIIEVQTVTPTVVVPETIKTITYSTLSERYSSINETTGFYKAQEYFNGYLSKDYIENTLTLSNLDNHSVYRTFHRNIAILDLDGDFKQDIVAFASSFCLNHEYANHPGKLLFISNYKESSDVLSFDIDAHNGSKMEVNDFNLDGISDVLFYTHDTKPNFFVSEENYGGTTNFEPNNPILIRFDNTIITNKVGIKADSHTGTSGDIDNDGDIDFIQWPIPGQYNGENTYYNPSVAINEGGIFVNYDLVEGLENPWYAASADLFDINQDGNLDLIVGWRAGTSKWPSYNNEITNTFTAPVILWGNGSGRFNMSNMTPLLESFLSERNIQAAILGYGFTDYDKDGDIDIIVSTTREEPNGNFDDGTYYDNYYLLFFENNNNSFIESTFLIQDSFNQSLSFPNFYSIRIVDIDNDGDFDLIPDSIANWGPMNYANSLHWKNTGNNYEKSW